MPRYEEGAYALRFEAWGDPAHTPVVFFHGFPGSLSQARGLIPHLTKHKIYLLSVDRPGYGGTSAEGGPARFFRALAALLSREGISRFHLVGVSGGSPWAHLMASQFPDRVWSLRIVCGLGPFRPELRPYFPKGERRLFQSLRYIPLWLQRQLVGAVMRSIDPAKAIEDLVRTLGPADQAAMRDPANLRLVVDSMREAREQGPIGIVMDGHLFSQDWLRLCDAKALARVPAFYVHGKDDGVVDYRMSSWMHGWNSGSRLTLLENEGHYSLPFGHADRLLAEIAAFGP